ncbi:hypothetical protein ACFFTO_43285 [Amycolatopsis plumensis]|uniref:Uncharacterized protein n=1 Tax=Amycolatopsis plumensis TaxID=236508 RepID=A0ABV5UI04_9PSEU
MLASVQAGRILDLYDHPNVDKRGICGYKFGPLTCSRGPGRSWFPVGRPGTIARDLHAHWRGPAHVAALDLATGQMFYRFRDRKR